MSDLLASIFNDFDRGRLSRRQLLQALGIAVVVRPAAALAQGSCGGARAGTPGCDPTPAKLPFERTGWNTVLLDHFIDAGRRLPEGSGVLRRAHELEDPQRRRQAGGARHRRLGRPRHSWRVSTAAGPDADSHADTDASGGRRAGAAAAGRGGGRGGGGGRGTPRLAVWDSFCWGIEPWDAKKVEAELKKRGLNPSPTTIRHEFPELPRQDPDGFDLQISNGSQQEPAPEARRARKLGGAGAVRGDELEDGVARSHLVRVPGLQRPASRSTRRSSAGSPARTKAARTRCRSATSATRSSAARTCRRRGRRDEAAADAAASGAAPVAVRARDGHRSHRVRHHAVGSGCGEGRARQAWTLAAAPTRAAPATSTRRSTRATTRPRRTDSTCKSATSPRRRAAANARGSESAPGSSGLRPVRKPL